MRPMRGLSVEGLNELLPLPVAIQAGRVSPAAGGGEAIEFAGFGVAGFEMPDSPRDSGLIPGRAHGSTLTR